MDFSDLVKKFQKRLNLVSELQKFVLCGSGKKIIQKCLSRGFFGIKFDPATSGRLNMSNSNFLDFNTLSTFFGNA